MDPILSKRQLFQSLGQVIVVMVMALIVFEDFDAFRAKGVVNALWNPFWQGVLSALGILGISRIGPGTAASEPVKKP